MPEFPKLATFKTVERFRAHLEDLAIELPCDEAVFAAPESPLSKPTSAFGRVVGNRFAIHPMEGWDGTEDGRPTENTIRRWRRFGESGAKLIWGGEAVAVRHDGRANPNQLMLTESTTAEIAGLREALVRAHLQSTGSVDGLIVGLQLTHSGRFARPNRKDRAEPMLLYRHPILDRRMNLPPDYPLMTDGEIRALIEDFQRAAKLAFDCGFDFVDIKHCHGYLGHEFLSAFTRPGPYGGSLENRARFLKEVVEGIRGLAPSLGVGVRLSAFDVVPYYPDPDQSLPGKLGPGIFETYCDFMPYKYAFGVNQDQPVDLDLTETLHLLEIMRNLGITCVNITAGSPYYNPHIQRPALYPPSDGYQPPEDPLIGVARQIHVVRYLKSCFPDLTFVGTGYTYLQEFLPNVAQAVVRDGWVDSVGLGRMVLSYPNLPLDCLEGRQLQTKILCRTFSDCTTAPRNGMVSGCYPLDPFYKKGPDSAKLAAIKKGARTGD